MYKDLLETTTNLFLFFNPSINQVNIIRFEMLLFSVYSKKCIATNSNFNLSLFYIVNNIIIYGL